MVDRNIIQIRGILISALCEKGSDIAFRRRGTKDDSVTALARVSTNHGRLENSNEKGATSEKESGQVDGSRVVTLVAGDVEKAIAGLECCHELWANVVQAAVALVLLHQNLGIFFLVPLGVAGLAACLSWYIVRVSPKRQGPWMVAMQSRLETTISFLDGFRSTRLVGLVEKMAERVQSKREEELKLLRHYRYMTISAVTVCETWFPLIHKHPVTLSILKEQKTDSHCESLPTHHPGPDCSLHGASGTQSRSHGWVFPSLHVTDSPYPPG